MDRVSLRRAVYASGLAATLCLGLTGLVVAGENTAGAGAAAIPAPVAGSPVSTIGLHQAVPNSTIEQIAVYLSSMRQAMALKDPVKRQAAIDRARAQLGAGSDQPMTPEMAARVDSLLGLDVIAPTAAQIQR